MKWYGFSPLGCVVPLGEHETIDEADTDETGGTSCTWIWSEEDLLKLQREIQQLLEEA